MMLNDKLLQEKDLLQLAGLTKAADMHTLKAQGCFLNTVLSVMTKSKVHLEDRLKGGNEGGTTYLAKTSTTGGNRT